MSALENSDLAIILLGSSMRARTCVDPFTAAEREAMITQAIKDLNWNYSVQPHFVPIRDFLYSENDWIMQVQRAVKEAVEHIIHGLKIEDCEVTIYGAEKEKEKEYLRQFPQWSFDIAEARDTNIGPQVLDRMFMSDWDFVEKHTGYETMSWLYHWISNTENGKRLREEYRYVREYKIRTQTGKYPIIFQTVDNVAYYKGNILLVKRRSQPGKGLWALPGGFLEASESRFDGALRELREETKLRAKPEWLVTHRGFDAPNRSIRGRTITEAFLWKIPDYRTVPQIQAGSDAAKVKWVPLSRVLGEMREQLFEDHLDIIETLIKAL
jgi:bifunctional NMN adenylyltransferase/nudix hydrolase